MPFESVIANIEKRLADLEKFQKTLLALQSSEGEPVIERGTCFFPQGDNIPKTSQSGDSLIGKIYAVKEGFFKKPLMVIKNTGRRELVAGDAHELGVVDTQLRYPCEPNNLCHVEL